LQYSRVEQEGREGNFLSLKLESHLLQSQNARALGHLRQAKCTLDYIGYTMLEELLDEIGKKMGKINSTSSATISLKRCHELIDLTSDNDSKDSF
jgi:hypothetical protein